MKKRVAKIWVPALLVLVAALQSFGIDATRAAGLRRLADSLALASAARDSIVLDSVAIDTTVIDTLTVDFKIVRSWQFTFGFDLDAFVPKISTAFRR